MLVLPLVLPTGLSEMEDPGGRGLLLHGLEHSVVPDAFRPEVEVDEPLVRPSTYAPGPVALRPFLELDR